MRAPKNAGPKVRRGYLKHQRILLQDLRELVPVLPHPLRQRRVFEGVPRVPLLLALLVLQQEGLERGRDDTLLHGQQLGVARAQDLNGFGRQRVEFDVLCGGRRMFRWSTDIQRMIGVQRERQWSRSGGLGDGGDFGY